MTASAQILAFSDINWSPHYRGINLEKLIGLVERVNPTLVLMAGDLVDNDKGGVRDEWLPYWQEISRFLNFLESNKVRCYLVKGNWHEKSEYEQLVPRSYSYIEEISERLVEANNIRTLGISHGFTNKLTTMKAIHNLCPESVDIVLTHAEGRRRIWLFELPAKLNITGHFDQKFCVVRDKVFLSFSNFPGQFAVIDYQPEEIIVTYFYGRSRREARIANGISVWATDQPKDWSRYGLQIVALLALKERENALDPAAKREAIYSLLHQGVYKAHILEYIPGAGSILK